MSLEELELDDCDILAPCKGCDEMVPAHFGWCDACSDGELVDVATIPGALLDAVRGALRPYHHATRFDVFEVREFRSTLRARFPKRPERWSVEVSYDYEGHRAVFGLCEDGRVALWVD